MLGSLRGLDRRGRGGREGRWCEMGVPEVLACKLACCGRACAHQVAHPTPCNLPSQPLHWGPAGQADIDRLAALGTAAASGPAGGAPAQSSPAAGGPGALLRAGGVPTSPGLQGPGVRVGGAPGALLPLAGPVRGGPPYDLIVGSDLIYYSYTPDTPHSELLLWSLRRLAGPRSLVLLALSLHHNEPVGGCLLGEGLHGVQGGGVAYGLSIPGEEGPRRRRGARGRQGRLCVCVSGQPRQASQAPQMRAQGTPPLALCSPAHPNKQTKHLWSPPTHHRQTRRRCGPS